MNKQEGAIAMTDYQVVWRGPVLSSSTGYGNASREYAAALHRQGVDVKVEAHTRGMPAAAIYGRKPDLISRLIGKPYAPNKPKLLIYHSSDWNIDIGKERKRFDKIVLMTAWETARIPRNKLAALNRYDAVFVPSSQNVKAMIRSGVTVPVYLAPYGADTDRYRPDNKKISLHGMEGRFVFVSVLDFLHRKNPELLLRAYWEEFTAADRTALVIKTYSSRHRKSGEWIRKTILDYKRKLGFGNDTAPLVLLTHVLEDEQMKGLYTLGNAFVLPSRGEAVGMPYMEALASGVPVIATCWGGQTDFLHDGNSFLVRCRLQNPAIGIRSGDALSPFYRSLFLSKDQLWAEPDLQDLKRQMRRAYENPELSREKGVQGREDMKRHTWDRGGIALKHAIEGLRRP
jgi:glycosyltransferase involved in cell wall biosynthesis